MRLHSAEMAETSPAMTKRESLFLDVFQGDRITVVRRLRARQWAFRGAEFRRPAQLHASQDLGLPLLYKGDDFAQTDVFSALAAGQRKGFGKSLSIYLSEK
jgi:hypothetical protein